MNRSSQAVVSEPSQQEAEDLVEAADPELPTDAALSALEDERTEAEASRLESKAAGDTMLSRYFRDMATHRVLRPDEEVEAAKRVEALERAYWVALFSYAPAFETVAAVTEAWLAQHEQPAPAELAELRKLVPAALTTALRQEEPGALGRALVRAGLPPARARRRSPVCRGRLRGRAAALGAPHDRPRSDRRARSR